MNALLHDLPAGSHDLPLLRRWLRLAGAVRRARRGCDRRRSRPPGQFQTPLRQGAALGETLGLEGRLLHPMQRQASGEYARIDWDKAFDTVSAGLLRVIERDGPDAVAFYLSGQLLTEDYYAANKLMKGFIGSANVDTNSRLCMASSVAGHRRAFGADTVPGAYADLDEADLLVLVGSNAAWCHPVLFQRMIQNKAERGAKIRRDRSTPHGDRGRRRPVPRHRAGNGHRFVQWSSGRSR